MEKKINFFGAVDEQFVPYFFDIAEKLLGDVAVKGFFIVIDRVFNVSQFFIMLGQCFGQIRLFVIDLDQPFPNAVNGFFLVFIFVTFRQGTKGELGFPVIKYSFAKIPHNNPFVVIKKYCYKAHHCRIIDDLL